MKQIILNKYIFFERNSQLIIIVSIKKFRFFNYLLYIYEVCYDFIKTKKLIVAIYWYNIGTNISNKKMITYKYKYKVPKYDF